MNKYVIALLNIDNKTEIKLILSELSLIELEEKLKKSFIVKYWEEYGTYSLLDDLIYLNEFKLYTLEDYLNIIPKFTV